MCFYSTTHPFKMWLNWYGLIKSALRIGQTYLHAQRCSMYKQSVCIPLLVKTHEETNCTRDFIPYKQNFQTQLTLLIFCYWGYADDVVVKYMLLLPLPIRGRGLRESEWECPDGSWVQARCLLATHPLSHQGRSAGEWWDSPALCYRHQQSCNPILQQWRNYSHHHNWWWQCMWVMQ